MKRIFLSLSLILITACAGGKIKDENLTDNGFISDDCWQIIITGTPEKNDPGLNAMRESSQIKAYALAEKEIARSVQKLIQDNYTALQQNDRSIAAASSPRLLTLYKKIYKNSAVAAEYFDAQNNCILVIRVKGNNLRSAWLAEAESLLSEGEKK